MFTLYNPCVTKCDHDYLIYDKLFFVYVDMHANLVIDSTADFLLDCYRQFYEYHV